MRVSRAAGRRWRVLAHKVGGYGNEVNLYSSDAAVEDDAWLRTKKIERREDDKRTVVEFPTVFDEVVIDDWFHLEQMGANDWWMAVSKTNGDEIVLNVRVRDGKATDVL